MKYINYLIVKVLTLFSLKFLIFYFKILQKILQKINFNL